MDKMAIVNYICNWKYLQVGVEAFIGFFLCEIVERENCTDKRKEYFA